MVAYAEAEPDRPDAQSPATETGAIHEKPVAPVGGRTLPAIIRWTRVATALLAIFVAAGRGSALHPILEVLSSFQLQYVVLAVVLTAVLLVGRSWRWALVGGVCLVATGAMVVPWYLPRLVRARDTRTPALRLMLANVQQENTRYDDVGRQIEMADPDLVVMQEINQVWYEKVQSLAQTRPHTAFVPGDFLRGTAVFSRMPLSGVRSECLDNPMAPTVICAVGVWGKSVTLVVTHPWPPSDIDSFRSRNEQLARVAALERDQPGPRILVGDLNTTMWSSWYRSLELASGMRNARRGFGVLATFPMDRLPLLRVPLDHCLVSADIAVRDCGVGRSCGSDHAPLIVELVPAAGL